MVEEMTFVPVTVKATERVRAKDGEKFLAYGIMSPDKVWLNTLNDEIAEECSKAKAEGKRVRIQYEVTEAGFKNIKDAKIDGGSSLPAPHQHISAQKPTQSPATVNPGPVLAHPGDPRQESIERQVKLKCAVDLAIAHINTGKTYNLKAILKDVTEAMDS